MSLHENERSDLQTSQVYLLDSAETAAVLDMQHFLKLPQDAEVQLHADITNPFGVQMMQPFGSITLPTDEEVYAANLHHINGSAGVLLALDSSELRRVNGSLERERRISSGYQDKSGINKISSAIGIYQSKMQINRLLGERSDREKVLARDFLTQAGIRLPNVDVRDLNRICFGIRTTSALPKELMRG